MKKKILIVDDEPNIVMSLEYAFKKKDFDTALKYYGYAQRVFENLLNPNDPILAECLNNFGSCYFENGDLKEALNYFKQALEISDNSSDSLPEKGAIYRTNIGQIHALNSDWESALVYYEGAIELLKNGSNHSLQLPSVLTAIGELFLKQNENPNQEDLKSALNEFSKALDILNQHWAQFQDPESIQILLDNNSNE